MKIILYLILFFSITACADNDDKYNESVAPELVSINIAANYSDFIYTKNGFAGATTKPLRYAKVSAFSMNNELIDETETDDLGHGVLIVNKNSHDDIFLKIELISKKFNVKVHTLNEASYVQISKKLSVEQLTANGFTFKDDPLDWGGAANIFDTIISGKEFLETYADGTYLWHPLTVLWSANESPGTSFDLLTGKIILNGGEGDNDCWDDAVILHEFAHFVLNYFELNVSGGLHSYNEMIEPKFAFTEGWPTYFAMEVLATIQTFNNGVYLDTDSQKEYFPNPILFSIDLNLDAVLDYSYAKTAGNEMAVAAALWNISQGYVDKKYIFNQYLNSLELSQNISLQPNLLQFLEQTQLDLNDTDIALILENWKYSQKQEHLKP